jgi:hypothetical protein
MGNNSSTSGIPVTIPELQTPECESHDHLFIMCHGLHGQPGEMDFMIQQISALHPELSKSAIFLPISANVGKTYDGVDSGGKRAAEQVIQVLEHGKDHIKKISVVGHSLGGLYGRYLIGYLWEKEIIAQTDQPGEDSSTATDKTLKYELVNFVILASPQVGSREHSKLIGSFLIDNMTATVLGRTGHQLMLLPNSADDSSMLLVEMNKPESSFMCCLKKFRKHLCYANLYYDLSVHYHTSSILLSKPSTAEVKKYIVENTKGKVVDLTKWLDDSKSTEEKDADSKLEDVDVSVFCPENGPSQVSAGLIYKELSAVPWFRFGVVDRPALSHVDIIVKVPGVNDYGAEVVNHMVSQLETGEI